MSQMVLPQNLSNSPSPEVAKTSGPARTGSEKTGESPYDAVSRSEQQRLDARDAKATRQDQARVAKPDADTPNAETTRPEAPGAEPTGAEESGQTLAAAAPLAAPLPADTAPLLGVGRELAESVQNEAVIDSVPVTFAGLQSLVASAQTPGVAPASVNIAGSGLPGNSQGLRLIQGGVNLQSPGQSGSTPGMALAETLLAGVTAEGAKAADTNLVQNAVRFQGALESVSPQASAVNTPKMAPDAPILRGYTTSIDVPVSHADWGDKIAGKLTWLTAKNMSVAEIHLTPPDMGPMEVRVQIQQDQANISVHSANPVVREQLELHSQRLRDMLSEQGFALAQFDVSDSGREQPGGGDAGDDQATAQGAIAEAEMDDAAMDLQSLDLTWKGEVDVFA